MATSDGSPSATARRTAGGTFPVLAVLPLALLIGCDDGRAATRGAASPAADVSVREVFTDTTGSLDPAVVRRLYPEVAVGIVSRDFVGPVRITPFADNGWSAMPKDSVILEPFRNADCADLEEKIRDTRLGRLKEKYREECRERTASLHRAIEERRAAAAARLRQMVVPAGLDPRVCTALWEVIQRVQRHPGPYATLIITDGQNTCDGEPASIPQPRRGTRVAVVVLPPGHGYRQVRSDLTHFENVRARFQRVAPWVRVLSPDEAARGVF